MSEKEQAEAIRLLTEWLAISKPDASNADDQGNQRAEAASRLRILIDRTSRFLRNESPTPNPESHGQRRS